MASDAAITVPASAFPTSTRRLFNPSWPLTALFVAYPIWWILGVGNLVWPPVALGVFLTLLRRKRLVAPHGFWLWLLFLLWVVLSATQVSAPDRAFAAAYRTSLYASATILFLYLFNLSRAQLADEKVVHRLAAFWAVVAVGGLLGLLLPGRSIPSAAELLLPASVLNRDFLRDIVQVDFAPITTFLGFPVGRPQAPFPFANAWGSNFALLTPFVLASRALTHSRWWRRLSLALLIASLASVISSLNRGLWLSLSAGLLYAGYRFVRSRNLRPMAVTLVLISAAAVLVSTTSLGTLIGERLEHPHSDDTRSALYREALGQARTAPLLGRGAPVESSLGGTRTPSVGTHGQLWLVLVSQGILGALAFLGWFGYVFWRTRHSNSTLAIWCRTVLLISIVQWPIYEQLPSQLHIVMVATALLLRSERVASVATIEILRGTPAALGTARHLPNNLRPRPRRA